MDTGGIIEKIQIGIDDAAVLKATILASINTRLKQVASGNFLPDLIEEDTVTVVAGTASISMPTNYDHSVLYAYSNTNEKELIVRSNSRVLYKDRDQTASGTVSEVAADGGVLRTYMGTEADDEINLRFYGMPAALVNDNDEPDCIPDHLRELILAEGVIYEFLSKKKPPTDQVEYKRWSDDKQNALSNLTTGLQLLGDHFKWAPRFNPVLRRRVRTF